MPTAIGNGGLPPSAYEALRLSLLARGFQDKAILRDYRFTVSEGMSAKADVLAFAHPVHRTPGDYAAISALHELEPERLKAAVDTLAHSGALFHLLHHSGAFHLWISEYDRGSGQPHARRVTDAIANERLSEALDDFGVDLSPQRIVDVKQGREEFFSNAFKHISPPQLSLWAAELSGRALREHFADAVDILRREQDRTGAWTDIDTTRIAVQLLGGVVLADTNVLGDAIRLNREVSLERLWFEGQREFRAYFDPIPRLAIPAAERALEVLRVISYAGFEPEMLIDLYTTAYRPEQRKALGRFDTPMYLTRAIWEHLPIEMLPPEQRLVCDMSSGWGSFLIAAYERLTRLRDMQGRELNQHLVGNDVDPYAALLSRFGLLMATGHDSWQVDAEDALTWPRLSQVRPNVIVGNPPFEGNRKKTDREGTGEAGERARFQRAEAFLSRAVDRVAPDGFVVMVLPLSFMTGEAGTAVRARIYHECDLFDLWELPEGTFPDAKAATSVIFLRKRAVVDRRSTAVSVRSVQLAHLDRFREQHAFSASRLYSAEDLWTDILPPGSRKKVGFRLRYNLIFPHTVYRALRGRTVRLDERAIVFSGCTEATERTPARKQKIEPRDVPYLPSWTHAVTERLHLDYDSVERRMYPTDFTEPRIASLQYLQAPKVVINTLTNPSWGQRLTAAVERRGYFISGSFTGVVPNPDARSMGINLEVLAAVLSWYVANAWIAGALRHTRLPKPAIHAIPFPAELTAEDIHALTEAVWVAEAAEPGSAEWQNAWKTIDEVLQRAYGLSDEDMEPLRRIAEFSGREGPEAYVTASALETPWVVDGVVDEVSAAEGTISLIIDGLDEPQTVAIQPQMPAWLLRPGVAFSASVSRRAWHARRLDKNSPFGPFSVAPYTYLSEAEVLDGLADLLASPRR